ncbi:ABC transporter permease [Jiangella sp. DSM 45060]|uniref:ABC transporter permease n=1 Tax=Jiangella sp. DSM 45060 TaxID=1798224 RepID=UPI00087DE29D|nr:FtsX-like permease family protein [Jiangella sp. DSM 45060]SDS03180.1 ABC-type transport system, involved in lipoprotein release, permease component [Jiangella sp. DSM 45060]
MTAAWLRLELRRRWRSLLVLALLVALAAGTVMTAVAGARRGASAVDRLLERTLPADVAVLPNQPGFDWDAVRDLPGVAALSTFGGAPYVVDGVPADSLGGAVGPDTMVTVERPAVLDGRLPDPHRADEATVTPRFVETYGLGVGDTVTIQLFRPESFAAFRADPSLPPDGPVVEARIVGVVRSFWHGDSLGGQGLLTSSAGLFERYPAELGAGSPTELFNAIARLDGGAAAIPAFQAELERLTGRTIDVWDLGEAFHQHARDVTGFEADALLVFALAAAAAAVFLVGQPVARYVAASVADLQALRGVGMLPRQVVAAAALGPVLAAAAGAGLGVAGAVAASRWFPIGSAATLEPAPGVDADVAVLGGGLLAVPVLVAVAAVTAAVLAVRAARTAPHRRRSAVPGAVAAAGLPVPVVVGARFALEPGRGRQAVPVRPALLGAVTGVAGVIAAFTFSSGADDATGDLRTFGQTHQLLAYLDDGADAPPAADVLAAAAADLDVAAVNDARIGAAEIGGVSAAVYAYAPVGDGVPDVVVLNGRMPARADEIVLAPATAAAAGAGVGDRVDLVATGGTGSATVTGIAYLPDGSHNDYTTGSWATRDGYDALFAGDVKFHEAHVELRPGADAALVADRLAEATGVGFAPPEPPTPVAEIRQIRTLPVALAGFLAVLALGAVGHALATAVRRRRHELAVLRAVGLTRRQSRAVVTTQASVLALAGMLIGVPLGVALGRTVWRYVAKTTPLLYVPPVAALALALVPPVALVAANLLAAWPSQRAASLRVSSVLRAE